jgi:hypothetical protein
MDGETSRTATLGRRLLAILILGVAVWILLRVVIGIVVAVASTIAVVAALIAIIWAYRVLR